VDEKWVENPVHEISSSRTQHFCTAALGGVVSTPPSVVIIAEFLVRRFFSVVCLTIAIWIVALPTNAATCRKYFDRDICILDIKRSAKYYWEYRAVVSIDSQRQPLQKYDCRHQVRIQHNGKVVPFEKGGAGELICKLLDR